MRCRTRVSPIEGDGDLILSLPMDSWRRGTTGLTCQTDVVILTHYRVLARLRVQDLRGHWNVTAMSCNARCVDVHLLVSSSTIIRLLSNSF